MTTPKTTYRKQQLKYIVVDLLSAECVWMLFLLFRWIVYEGRIFGVDTILIPAFKFYQPLILYPLSSVLIYYLSGFYLRPQPQNKRIPKVFGNTLVCAFIISLSAFFCIAINDNINDYTDYYLSLVVLFLLQLIISFLSRLSVALYDNIRWKKGYMKIRTLVVGDKESACQIVEELCPTDNVLSINLSDINTISEVITTNRIQRVIIATTSDVSKEFLYQLINRIYPLQVEISFTPSVYDMLIGAAHISNLEGTPLVTITEQSMSDWQICVKRLADILTSLFCLVLLSPLYLIIAILVKTSSPGPIIYKQERIGLYGRPFMIWKFRTMEKNAEQTTPLLTSPNDSRITPIGHCLRKYRLDELPQFWNVLKGDMSIVGPRPERAYYIQQIMQKAPYYCLLYKIRPGLTSWGPIRVGYTDTIEKMIQRLNFDMVYMENMSLLLDIKILFYTIRVIVDGKGQ